MSKINQTEYAVDHGISERDQGIDATQDQAINDLLKKDIQV
jgi:hypothetical protein